jgi:hypothetical protein
VDAEPLRLSLSCDSLGIELRGAIEVAPLGRALSLGRRGAVPLLHAKRDGQACFAYVDELTGAATDGQSSGLPGEIFAFGGDPSGSAGERRGQLVVVYGPDNLFVEPFDRGFHERRYRRVGAIDDVPALARLGERMWRDGSRLVELELTEAE